MRSRPRPARRRVAASILAGAVATTLAACGGSSSSSGSGATGASASTTASTTASAATTKSSTTATRTSAAHTSAARPTANASSAVGLKVFTSAGCGSCHTLAAAHATGDVGPNLDDLKPSEALVARQVANGGGAMPSFAGRLSRAQIAAVAEFVASAAG